MQIVVMAKALDSEMYNYFIQLNDAEKKTVIQMIKTFLKGRNEKPEAISLEQYNKELDEAEAQYQNGDYVSHEELLKEMKKW